MRLGDCNLGAASYLLKDKGLNITPEMCFGIGEGYGFSFWVEKSNWLPVVVIMGRTRSCEEDLFRKCISTFSLFDALFPQESEIEKEIVTLERSFTGSKSRDSKYIKGGKLT